MFLLTMLITLLLNSPPPPPSSSVSSSPPPRPESREFPAIKERGAVAAAVVITVSGAVRNPTRIELRRSRISVLEVLAAAGGLTENAKDVVQITRERDVRNNPGEKQARKTESYNLNDLLTKKSVPRIDPGDHIFVPEADVIYVVGGVRKPGAYLMKKPIKVSEAVELAGGTLPNAISLDILLCSRSGGGDQNPELESIKLNTVEKDATKDFLLGAGDVIFARSISRKISGPPVSCPKVGNENRRLPVKVLY